MVPRFLPFLPFSISQYTNYIKKYKSGPIAVAESTIDKRHIMSCTFLHFIIALQFKFMFILAFANIPRHE